MHHETLIQIIGDIYAALCDAIGPKAASEANATLLAFAGDTFVDPAVADVYRDFVDSFNVDPAHCASCSPSVNPALANVLLDDLPK
jgi:hypothetical protein